MAFEPNFSVQYLDASSPDGPEESRVAVDGPDFDVRVGRQDVPDDGGVVLVDGPVEARLVVLPPNVDVGVTLDQRLHDTMVASLGSMGYPPMKRSNCLINFFNLSLKLNVGCDKTLPLYYCYELSTNVS